jgi:hypothetical protein
MIDHLRLANNVDRSGRFVVESKVWLRVPERIADAQAKARCALRDRP